MPRKAGGERVSHDQGGDDAHRAGARGEFRALLFGLAGKQIDLPLSPDPRLGPEID